MTWKVEITNTAKKQLEKLDKQAGKTILDYLETRIATDKDPCRLVAHSATHLPDSGNIVLGNTGLFVRFKRRKF